MKLSPCLGMFYADLPFVERMRKIKDYGFDAFEFWCWWDEDPKQIAAEAKRLGLTVVACCTKFVSLVEPSQREAYLTGLRESIAAAKIMGCTRLISQVGNELPGVPREQQRQSLVDGLKDAAPLLAADGITLVVEPLNLLFDHAGYFLARSDEALEIIRQVGSPYVKLVFDIYHQQITEGNLIPNIEKCFKEIAHFHTADHPGRHDLGSGEINYVNVLKKIEDLGYEGYVGLEYTPVNTYEQALQSALDVAPSLVLAH
jgi:hydroxypyruvate isomerase